MSFTRTQGKDPGIVYNTSISNTAQDMFTVPVSLVKVISSNSNNTIMYIQLFDIAASEVTVGTTLPKYILPVPPQGGIIDDMSHTSFFEKLSVAVTTTPTGLVAPGTALFIEVVAG